MEEKKDEDVMWRGEEEAEQDCASGPQGGENIFSGLGLKAGLGYINTRPLSFPPILAQAHDPNNVIGLAEVGQQMPLRAEMSTCEWMMPEASTKLVASCGTKKKKVDAIKAILVQYSANPFSYSNL